MVFSSYAYVLFLAVVVTLWLELERRGWRESRKVVLICASLVFYAWWRADGLILLLGSIAANYAIGRHIQGNPVRRRGWMIAGIALNLGVLGLFKYLGLLDRSVESLLGYELALPSLFLPLAISFFTFQQISWLADCRAGTAPAYGVIDYTLFICFFPHLIAGPIVLHHELIPQFDRLRGKEEQARDLAAGLTLFTLGLSKKVLLANQAAPFADAIFAEAARGTTLSAPDAWLGALMFAAQIYFDFSGYTDMALGSALMLGIRLPMNFNSPYKAASIIDFWRRWHISLSTFLRDYLYIPLGGNRRGETRRYINLMATMLIGGLWHGASWTFAVWGGLHGAFLTVNHLWRAANVRIPESLKSPAAWAGAALTFLAVTFAWVFFRADSFEAAGLMVRAMAGFGGEGLLIAGQPLTWLLAGGLLAITWWAPNSLELLAEFDPALNMGAPPARRRWMAWRPTPALASGAAVLFMASALTMTNLRPFIYFQF
ncbi:MAG: MBOAT family protein [Caulobacteraceae bacterium]